MDSVFDRILVGDVLESMDDLHTLIKSETDLWHKGDTGFSELHVYLGMSFEEYALWVETDDIGAVIKMHRGLADTSYEEMTKLKKKIVELTNERDRWIARNAELERKLAIIRREAR
jgi:hypothetical protein